LCASSGGIPLYDGFNSLRIRAEKSRGIRIRLIKLWRVPRMPNPARDPGYVLITSNDTVAGYPVRRIGINPFEDISRSVRYDELKKLAASGKTATLRGWFMHVHGRAAEGMAIPLAFNLVKGG
jgi:hypothetical protein